jgi:Ras-related protein Rab-18
VPTDEGARFAARNGCLFVEASAKTAEGVTEAFSDVVARIIDTPSLWREDFPRTPINVVGPYLGGSNTENINRPSITNGSSGCLC